MLVLRRVVQMALILLGVAAITFVLLYALPADPARIRVHDPVGFSRWIATTPSWVWFIAVAT